MKEAWKRNAGYLLFLSVFGLIGGYFTGLYTIESMTPQMREMMLEQVGSEQILILVTTVQSLLYGLVCGLLGKVLAKKLGLWEAEWKPERKSLIAAAIVGAVSGCAMILFDLLWFGNMFDVIRQSYDAKPTIHYLIASLTYGGVIEEVMLRLFLMSLVAVILQKLFGKGKKEVSAGILMVANGIAAALFAAGHLPATALILGLSPLIIFRCFLLNGGIGLLFGRLYRKYGIQYAMLAHMGAHVVSKLIWILFV